MRNITGGVTSGVATYSVIALYKSGRWIVATLLLIFFQFPIFAMCVFAIIIIALAKSFWIILSLVVGYYIYIGIWWWFVVVILKKPEPFDASSLRNVFNGLNPDGTPKTK